MSLKPEKKMVTDTDGALDRCHCGARAKFVHLTNGAQKSCRAECTECAETTDFCGSCGEAMTAWNKARRGVS